MQNNTNTNTTNETETERFYVANPLESIEDKFIGLEPFAKIKKNKIIKQTFAEWNNEQLEKNRIHYPCPFTIEVPIIKFGKIMDGTAINDKGENVKFKFINYKEDKGSGREISTIITSPAVNSFYGYRENDTGSGKVKSFAVSFDMNNPHHRHFLEFTWKGITDQIVEFIMMNPGPFKFEFNSTNITDDYRESDDYRDNYRDIYKGFSKIIRFPKLGEEADLTSNLRSVYVNPMKYLGEKNPDGSWKKKPSDMIVYLPGNKDPITPEHLERICLGYEYNRETNTETLGKPKGFECSFSWLCNRVVGSSKISIQPKCSALFIHKIYDAPERTSRNDIHLSELQNIQEDFSKFVGISGFKGQEPERQNIVFEPISSNIPESNNIPTFHQGQTDQSSPQFQTPETQYQETQPPVHQFQTPVQETQPPQPPVHQFQTPVQATQPSASSISSVHQFQTPVQATQPSVHQFQTSVPSIQESQTSVPSVQESQTPVPSVQEKQTLENKTNTQFSKPNFLVPQFQKFQINNHK